MAQDSRVVSCQLSVVRDVRCEGGNGRSAVAPLKGMRKGRKGMAEAEIPFVSSRPTPPTQGRLAPPPPVPFDAPPAGGTQGERLARPAGSE